MLSLTEVEATCTVNSRRYAGIRTVPIEQIRGSEGRSTDFDRYFHPLQDHTRGRWLSIARAREQGKALPLIDLVQVGDIYFVLDGHHRISVARALGQQDIEAKVMAWQVAGPFSWETQPGAEGLTRREKIERLYSKVRDDSVRLQERFRELWIAVGLRLRGRRVFQMGTGDL
jgi:hypothetical protein